MLLSVSPNGKKICLGFNPGGPFARIDVIETDLWRVLYSGKFNVFVGFDASFFAGDESIYVNTGEIGVLVNTGSGERRERPRASTYPGRCHALTDGIVLRQGPDGSLVLEQLPNYEEVRRIDGGETSALMVTADRRRVFRAYGSSDHWVECYETSNLHRLWSRRVEIPEARWDLLHNFKGVLFTAPSASGNEVALAAVDILQWGQQKRAFVAVLNGDTGADTNRLSINATEGLAISPDGRLLAVGRHVQAGDDINLILEVYDASSGALLASAAHERVPPGRWQAAMSRFDGLDSGLAFTADGRYLLSSGANIVKVWQLA